MKVQHVSATVAIVATTLFFSTTAEARPTDEIRGQVAVVRGHSIALREFLKAKCRVLPNAHAAQALAADLACRADELWDLVRRDCRGPAEIERQFCAVEAQYRVTNDAVRAIAAWAPRHHIHHACHLLERIDHHLCKARRIMTAWSPVIQPPLVHRPIHQPFVNQPFINQPFLNQPIGNQHPLLNAPLQLRPGRSHILPHYDPHTRPHLEPHQRVRHPHHVRRGGKVHLRIGGLTLCF